MKIRRQALWMAIGILATGVVQAQSASLYPKSKKELAARQHWYKALEARTSPDVSVETQAPAVSTTTVMGAPVPDALKNPLDKPATLPGVPVANKAGVNDAKPDDVLPPGSRVVAGDEVKGDFYILTQNQPDPVKPEPEIKSLPPSDPLMPLLSLNNLPRVDDILSQIAHKVIGTKSAPPSHPASVTQAAKPLPKAEKNGDVVDVQVALDKTFVDLDKANPMDNEATPAIKAEPVAFTVPAVKEAQPDKKATPPRLNVTTHSKKTTPARLNVMANKNKKAQPVKTQAMKKITKKILLVTAPAAAVKKPVARQVATHKQTKIKVAGKQQKITKKISQVKPVKHKPVRPVAIKKQAKLPQVSKAKPHQTVPPVAMKKPAQPFAQASKPSARLPYPFSASLKKKLAVSVPQKKHGKPQQVAVNHARQKRS